MSSKPRGFMASPEGLQKLEAAKASLNLSFAAIAKQAGVETDTVMRLFHPSWEKRVSEVSLAAIARVLTVTPREITAVEVHSSNSKAFALAQRRIKTAIAYRSTNLDLSRLELTSLPNEIGQLNDLIRLDLSQSQLTSLPKEIGQLNNLAWLDLSQNQLTSLPKEIGQLNSLTRLDLSQNQLTSLPKEIGQLNKLTKLDLSHNQLTSLPKEIGQLNSLTWLDLSKNKLTSLLKEIGQLNNLTDLDLSQNQLTLLPTEIGQLSNLTDVGLDHNQLTSLPAELWQLNSLTNLFLHENDQLGVSVEILGPTRKEVNSGATPAKPADILNYYFRIQDDRQPLNEAKLILVGFGAVGKTSLVNRLIHNTFDQTSKKTEGINITQWPIQLNQSEDITLHVWDFGGQEIMHSTHQFFLTERSLYLLVLNGRQGHEDTDAEYWLELIQSFGGDSPIIVVLNKVAEHPFDVNRRALQQKFPNIREFIQTDCDTETGIDTLRTAI
ncbi:leucine-rich repeat domain-containing protein [Leptothoe spongobia]|uniref:Leucine-rich repeat domain-containing protein n=1 Tax=Leptothoe spongobia TAU-MAC 1115 TaxID=1967444 RepID=A0A947DDQ7_9CYAN|nr:leucine-rich repeat domain-containing protein [Leptothoe spongobia]MBT9315187.1 leucine-rich repeat domain-containing protein [Leptothoe spongobia TAU-MAC 1115]